MITITNVITGEVREIDAKTPEGALYVIYDDWMRTATDDQLNSSDVQFAPYYDDRRNVWFWNGWEVQGARSDRYTHQNDMMFTSVSFGDGLEVTMDVGDYDGPTRDYETTIHVDAPTLYRLIFEHAPECIVSKKVGCFYE